MGSLNEKLEGSALLELHFMGTPKVVANEMEITGTLSSKAIGILAYLVVNCNEQVARERLASIFWCDSDRQAAKYNLRHALWSINRVCRSRGIVTDFLHQEDKEYCMLMENGDWYSDVIMLEKGVEALGDNPVAYRGEFLQDLPMKSNPELDNWIICERERLQRLFFDSVSRQTLLHQQEGDYASAINGVENLLAMNPLQEDLHLRLMELYFKNHQRVQAIQQYHKCRDILRRELNISPMAEMKAFFQQILQDESTGSVSDAAPGIWEKAGQAEQMGKAFENRGAPVPGETVGLEESSEAMAVGRVKDPQQQRQCHLEPEKGEGLPYEGLAALVTDIDLQAPQVIEELPPAYLDEISKLLMNRRVTGVPLSPEIEKLRIFKAVAYLLQQVRLEDESQRLADLRMADKCAAEFSKWYQRRLSARESHD